MTSGNSGPAKFKWYNADEALNRLVREYGSEPSPDQMLETPVGEPDEQSDDYQVLLTSLREPRRNVDLLFGETSDHLAGLGVVGSEGFSDDEMRQLGPILARDSTYREDAVFHILKTRREMAPDYMKRLITVRKRHLLQYGLWAQSGHLSMDKIQNSYNNQARFMFEPLVEEDEFEDSFLSSNLQRRVLRALFYIATEPTESTRALMSRMSSQAQDTGRFSAEELLGRLYNFTHTQYEKHQRQSKGFTGPEEDILKLLEEGRLRRLMTLGRTVLVAGLGVITAQEYQDEE